MRKFYILLALALAFSFSVQAINEEKSADKSEYSVQQRADAVSGFVDNTSPEFERRFGNGYDAGCAKSSSLSGLKYYNVYPFYSTTGEALDISSTSTGGSSDFHFTVYCEPFDPANTDLNIKAIDDDDGPGYMPAFAPADAYMIDANTQYYLVMAPFSGGATGSYDITLGGNLVLGVVPAPPSVPLSNWAFALIGLFALTLVFFKFKK